MQDKTSYNNNITPCKGSNPHGYWKKYWCNSNDSLWFEGYYVNDVEYGLSKYYGGSPLSSNTYYAR